MPTTDPDDLAAHSAYADYLAEQGDPFGQFAGGDAPAAVGEQPDQWLRVSLRVDHRDCHATQRQLGIQPDEADPQQRDLPRAHRGGRRP